MCTETPYVKLSNFCKKLTEIEEEGIKATVPTFTEQKEIYTDWMICNIGDDYTLYKGLDITNQTMRYFIRWREIEWWGAVISHDCTHWFEISVEEFDKYYNMDLTMEW